tara:strand:+ start:239 stop:445 length:207 start_codon:yes stop_codon:yes gene_type:complete
MKLRKNRRCPECGSNNVLLIDYGYIDNPDAIQQIENGEIVTGGCCIDEDSPKRECRDCEERFGKINWS